jgi:hypothetical protein
MLAKNWRLCTQLAASSCKICFGVALSSIVLAHFPNQIPKGRQLNSQKHGQVCGLANAKKYNYDVKMAFYTHLLSACLLSCNRVAASRMQILANFIHVACNWWPRGYNFHATGGHSGTI